MYRFKHNAVQVRINRAGFFVLFTNTRMSAEDILRIYRQKDAVEKISLTGMTYQLTSKITLGIKEVPYTNWSHSVFELTKEQRGGPEKDFNRIVVIQMGEDMI